MLESEIAAAATYYHQYKRYNHDDSAEYVLCKVWREFGDEGLQAVLQRIKGQ